MAVMATDLLAARARWESLPEDGVRRELIAGEIVVSPSPTTPHQRMASNLFLALHSARPDQQWDVFAVPVDVFLGDDVLVPDVQVAPRAAYQRDGIHVAPALVVEVRSPSTARRDEIIKREIYQRAGVPSYWLVDPDVPAVTVREIGTGVYLQKAHAVGDQTILVTAPFPVHLNPARLAAD